MRTGTACLIHSETRCDTCPARYTGVCEIASDAARAALAARSRVSHFAAGTPILEQGEVAEKVGNILSGNVKVVNMTEDGTEQVLGLLSAGDVVGDPLQGQNSVSWEAATDVTMCWVPRAALEGLMHDHKSLVEGYLGAVVKQLDAQRMWSASLRGHGTVQRVAGWLMQQVPVLNDEGHPIIQIRLTRRDLSSLLDMTVETLCRSLHQLEEKGAVHMLAPDTVMVTRATTLGAIAKAPNGRVDAAIRRMERA